MLVKKICRACDGRGHHEGMDGSVMVCLMCNGSGLIMAEEANA